MKPKKINYGRTFCHNYQSYRADIQVELEPWESDLDATFDNLRNMVDDQIGKQCSDFTDDDRAQVAPLRCHLRRLEKQADDLQVKVSDLEFYLKQLRSRKADPVLSLIDDLLAVLRANSISEQKLLPLLDSRERFLLVLDSLDKPAGSRYEFDDDEDDEDDEDDDSDDL